MLITLSISLPHFPACGKTFELRYRGKTDSSGKSSSNKFGRFRNNAAEISASLPPVPKLCEKPPKFSQVSFSTAGKYFLGRTVTTEEIGKSRWREILAQINVWKPQEYFVYFKVYRRQRWGKRSANGRRRFLQWLPQKQGGTPCRAK